jgi:hypothetical protein
MGLFFLGVLVADWSDNACVWPALVRMGLLVASACFALCALLPVRVDRGAAQAASAFLWLLAVASLAFVLPYLITTLVDSPAEAVRDGVFVTHLLGQTVLLLVAAWTTSSIRVKRSRRLVHGA